MESRLHDLFAVLSTISDVHEHRLHTAACFVVITWLFFGWILTAGLLFSLLQTDYYYIALIYLIWYIFDWGRQHQGGTIRVSASFRHLAIFRYCSQYFPVKLFKTVDLPPQNNYIFGYHPHGIAGIGSFCSFLTESTNFSLLFPELRPHLLMTRVAFWWPGSREIFMALGGSSATKENLTNITQTKGNAIVVQVGGAAESLEAQPGGTRLVLKHRKGFIKMAIQNG